MIDFLLQLERDPEIRQLLESLTPEEQEVILCDIRLFSESVTPALQMIKSLLVTEEALLNFTDTVGSSIGMGDISDNVGTEEIRWPERH